MRVCVNACACVEVCACKYVCNAHLCKAVCLSVCRCEGVHVCMCVCVCVCVCTLLAPNSPCPHVLAYVRPCRRHLSARLSRLDRNRRCSGPTYRSTASSRVPHANAGKYIYIYILNAIAGQSCQSQGAGMRGGRRAGTAVAPVAAALRRLSQRRTSAAAAAAAASSPRTG